MKEIIDSSKSETKIMKLQTNSKYAHSDGSFAAVSERRRLIFWISRAYFLGDRFWQCSVPLPMIQVVKGPAAQQSRQARSPTCRRRSASRGRSGRSENPKKKIQHNRFCLFVDWLLVTLSISHAEALCGGKNVYTWKFTYMVVSNALEFL